MDRFSPNDPAKKRPFERFECVNEACPEWATDFPWTVYGSHDSGVFVPDVEADTLCPECQEEGRIA